MDRAGKLTHQLLTRSSLLGTCYLLLAARSPARYLLSATCLLAGCSQLAACFLHFPCVFYRYIVYVSKGRSGKKGIEDAKQVAEYVRSCCQQDGGRGLTSEGLLPDEANMPPGEPPS